MSCFFSDGLVTLLFSSSWDPSVPRSPAYLLPARLLAICLFIEPITVTHTHTVQRNIPHILIPSWLRPWSLSTYHPPWSLYHMGFIISFLNNFPSWTAKIIISFQSLYLIMIKKCTPLFSSRKLPRLLSKDSRTLSIYLLDQQAFEKPLKFTFLLLVISEVMVMDLRSQGLGDWLPYFLILRKYIAGKFQNNYLEECLSLFISWMSHEKWKVLSKMNLAFSFISFPFPSMFLGLKPCVCSVV